MYFLEKVKPALQNPKNHKVPQPTRLIKDSEMPAWLGLTRPHTNWMILNFENILIPFQNDNLKQEKEKKTYMQYETIFQ